MSRPQETGSEQKEQIVKHLAEDYAKYFIVDTTQERGALDHELESMLTRLEEYGSLLDRVSSGHELEGGKGMKVGREGERRKKSNRESQNQRNIGKKERTI
ncbi:uncharacterized protein LOC125037872 [Penaeus chinensis]|uniref:uncharacterized protein LOC125037872 n=1 Tax=Penaeus chinensis TaxID=139456 RepID=UPI001FB6DEF1|nr:uncharacterized protein LOC125037872 [Penaeus chinensis]